MKTSEVLIKWTGTKRVQAPEIIKYFPENIKTYHEPFLGGGSMMYTLMSQNKVKIENYRCSDISSPLIGIYQLIKSDCCKLVEDYTERWNLLDSEGKYYYQIREEFNSDKCPCKFFFLLRTCRNGLVRFNRQGHFNIAYHHLRKGIHPDKISKIIKLWHSKFNDNNVTFDVVNYNTLQLDNQDDFLYLDPPYFSEKHGPVYHGFFDHHKLFEWLKLQKPDHAMSLNGFRGESNNISNVPEDLYNEHVLIYAGLGQPLQKAQINQTRVKVFDSLYIKRKQSFVAQTQA